MAPPSITKPFSILGSTTRMNGGANGKLSGKIRCRRTLGTFSSAMSCANGDSGSRWYSRTCHSNKLSLINSACKWMLVGWAVKINKIVENERKFNFYANFCAIFMFTENIFSLRSFCDFCSSLNSFISRLARIVVSILGTIGSLDLLLLLGAKVLLGVGKCKRIKHRMMTTKRLKVINDNHAIFHACKIIKFNDFCVSF